MLLGVVPLIWLLALLLLGRRVETAYGWIAVAFGVSYLADFATIMVTWDAHLIPVIVYPVSQSALVGAVLLPRRKAIEFVAALVGLGVLCVSIEGVTQLDTIFTCAAWLSVALIAWRYWQLPLRLRLCVLVYFGLGALVWPVFTHWRDPLYRPWYLYQATRTAGIGLFCWAAWNPAPVLRAR